MRIVVLSKADIQGNINLNSLIRAWSGVHDLNVFISDSLLESERGNAYAELCTWYDRDYPLTVFFPAVDRYLKCSGEQAAELYTFSALRGFCSSLELIPQHSPHEFMEEKIFQCQPDLIVCCRFDYLLKDSILTTPRLGVINTHSGALPHNCGPNASFQAMYQGVQETACTVHWATPQVDGGPVLTRSPVLLNYAQSLFHNRMRIYEAGIQALLELVPAIEHGRAAAEVQDTQARKYFPYPGYSEFSSFVTQGKTLYCPNEYMAFLSRYLPAGKDWVLPCAHPAACAAVLPGKGGAIPPASC